jgi:hypothetical protein
MFRHKYHIIVICSIFLLSLGVLKAEGDEYVKNIEMTEADINMNHQEFPAGAYLYVTLKNNGDRKVSNVTFEISYYGKEGYLIKKSRIKNALNDAIPAREMRKYKVRLNGNVVNARNEQYPYSQQDEVAEFDVKIVSVKL